MVEKVSLLVLPFFLFFFVVDTRDLLTAFSTSLLQARFLLCELMYKSFIVFALIWFDRSTMYS